MQVRKRASQYTEGRWSCPRNPTSQSISLHLVHRFGIGKVYQITAPPPHPLPGIACAANHDVAHLVGANVRVVWKYERRIVAIDFFEKYILLAVLAAIHQLLLLASRLVVHTRFGLPDHLEIVSRMQHPTTCAGPEGNLQFTQ